MQFFGCNFLRTQALVYGGEDDRQQLLTDDGFMDSQPIDCWLI